jgi:myo-inositol 2-dehydrogenase / D-chiro-inositol 1-dehydrogenase
VSDLRFGLIGFGAWGRFHAESIQKAPGARLAAIAARSDATAEAAHQAFPGARIHRDWQNLLKDPGIDAVDIVVPNHLHREIGVAALKAGKHVLLEKPMANSIADCDALIAAARSSGKQLAIGHEFRLSTQWGLIKRVIDEGRIGRPLHAMVSLFRFPYRQGSGGWRYNSEAVGSWILEEPVHFFDMLMWYFEGVGDPVSVQGFGNSKGREPGMYDNFSTVMRFPGGAYAVVNQTLAGFEHHHVVEIVGTEGSIRTWWSGTMDRTSEPKHELKMQLAGQSQSETVALERSGEVFELGEELAHVTRAFQEGRTIVSGAEARKRIVVCLEAERSVREGREVPLHF